MTMMQQLCLLLVMQIPSKLAGICLKTLICYYFSNNELLQSQEMFNKQVK